MSRSLPTDVEQSKLARACSTCGARRRRWCTVGQYGSPSPHASTREAQYLHARR